MSGAFLPVISTKHAAGRNEHGLLPTLVSFLGRNLFGWTLFSSLPCHYACHVMVLLRSEGAQLRSTPRCVLNPAPRGGLIPALRCAQCVPPPPRHGPLRHHAIAGSSYRYSNLIYILLFGASYLQLFKIKMKGGKVCSR